MKVTSDNVKAGLMLAGVAIAAYAAWRVYKVGDSAASAVSETVSSVGDWFKEKGAAIGGAVSGAIESAGKVFEPSIDETVTHHETAAVRGAILQAQVTPAGLAGASFEDGSTGRTLDLYGGSSGTLGSDSRVTSGTYIRSPDSFEDLSGRVF